MADPAYLASLVRPQPFELRYYPECPLDALYSPLLSRWRCDNLPQSNRMMVDSLKSSIADRGMRNPLTVEWFAEYADKHDPSKKAWSVRIGNNRLIAVLELGWRVAPALVVVPLDDIPDNGGRPTVDFPFWDRQTPSGDYEVLNFMSALALFDASHPWWHSYILRKYRPDLVPPAA